MPATVLMTTGKKQMTAAMTTLELIPKPNHVRKIGASATRGVFWKAMTKG